MNDDYWSAYSLIPQPASLGSRYRTWPFYVGMALIIAGLAYLIVLGAA